jgi:hypothetical protein
MRYFSLSFGFNYFSLTALMVLAGLSGNSSLAADIGMVHSVTAVLFLGLSANARNVILGSSGEKANIFMIMRSVLMLPLGVAAVYICVSFHDVGYLLAGTLTMRRASEWLMEIGLSDREVKRESSYARNYFVAQAALSLLVCLALAAGGGSLFEWTLAIWSVSPFLWLRLKLRMPKLDRPGLRDLFPHVGSTLIIGIGLYMFRGMLIALLGKEYAGDLFSAFALGGVVPSIYGNVVGPGIESETRRGGAGWAKALRHDVLRCLFVAMILAGAGIFLWTKSSLFIGFLGKSDLFWGAVGASVVGGAMMLLMQVQRTALLQSAAVGDVFAPDFLMNFVIIASVPYAFYLLGERSMIFLFLWNSCIGWLFYKSYASMHERSAGMAGSVSVGDAGRRWAKYAVAVFVVLPVFFQVGHGLFLDRSMVYDSGGILKDLPIPVSAAACCFGILLLSNYRHTVKALYLIFSIFCLMAVSAAVSAQGDMMAMKAKIILMMQYLVPWSGLVLGHMFVEKKSDMEIIQRAFLCVVLPVVLLQLAVSLPGGTPGEWRLQPYLYAFSIYQHTQYVPVVLCGAYLVSLFGLYDRSCTAVLILSSFIGLYAFASTSRAAVILLVIGVLLLSALKPKDKLRWLNAALVILSVICAFKLNAPRTTGKFALLLANQSQAEAITKEYVALSGPPRYHYWEYYIDKIERSGKRNIFFGQRNIPDRATSPSAHNYYLDYLFNFGLVALVPFLGLILYSALTVWRRRKAILSSSSLAGFVVVLPFVALADNFVKVGLRQPYSGIFTFFLWGVLLRTMNEEEPAPADSRRGPA